MATTGKSFRQLLDDEAMKTRTRVDFLVAQKSGVRGFPTLVAGDKTERLSPRQPAATPTSRASPCGSTS